MKVHQCYHTQVKKINCSLLADVFPLSELIFKVEGISPSSQNKTHVHCTAFVLCIQVVCGQVRDTNEHAILNIIIILNTLI